MRVEANNFTKWLPLVITVKKTIGFKFNIIYWHFLKSWKSVIYNLNERRASIIKEKFK